MFKKINNSEVFFGVVVQTDDPLQAGRIKVRVQTVFDDLDVELIPWAESKQDIIEHDLPAQGEIVFVEFPYNVAYMPVWYRKRSTYKGKVKKDDYTTASILLEKDLERYNLKGKVRVSFTESEGVVLELEKNNKNSTFIIRPDNTIFIKNAGSNQVVHLAKDNISIGREDKSQQPAVVGNDNMTALQKLNDEIKTLAELIEKWTSRLATVCSFVSVLKPLKPIFKGFGAEVKSKINSLHSENNNFFPETKSQVVTVDKTKPS
ncbi:baseplate protein [Tenacibaculum phage PTm1]|uniref:Baseplate hub subunit and tail lysozyme n=2 Tax=Shirahamavirus PTm1 TaxID=2846435 RepID=A0A5S9HXG3_9CAUD|nr:baseplate protein [Tenacibaculum phage PTm1]BBI90626.1 baseplate hub subunit and tail lysozyme [Tenacibaculum phage PTm1]BBI90932.1 baseplate hub subunit and tail lysozyme [Tenacibaculum phage PTm5]